MPVAPHGTLGEACREAWLPGVEKIKHSPAFIAATNNLGRGWCCEAAMYTATVGRPSAFFGECKCAPQPVDK